MEKTLTEQQQRNDEPASPCIGVCQINPDTGWCAGCYRSSAEVQGWWDYSNEEKRGVLAELPQRQEKVFAQMWS